MDEIVFIQTGNPDLVKDEIVLDKSSDHRLIRCKVGLNLKKEKNDRIGNFPEVFI